MASLAARRLLWVPVIDEKAPTCSKSGVSLIRSDVRVGVPRGIAIGAGRELGWGG